MSGAALGIAFGAMQVIYAAYRDIKTNKEKCTALVERAELVVEELKLLSSRQAKEEMITERIGTLLSAFETTAQVIRRIGHKNWLKALLDADRDATQVEQCHHRLTDLMILFNIERGLDQWALQRENECARKRDHTDLLQVAQSVQSELTTQGEIIGEVLEMVRTLSQSPTFNAPAHSASPPNPLSAEFSRPELSKSQPLVGRHMDEHRAGDNLSATAFPQRRGSWANILSFRSISAIRLSVRSVGRTESVKTRGVGRVKIGSGRAQDPLAPAMSLSKYKTRGFQVPSRSLPRDNIGREAGVLSPERGRKRTLRQPETFQPASPKAQFTYTPGIRPNSRSPSTSPCGLKHVEVRYYSGNMACGVLLSEAFESLGKTTIGELRLASCHPNHPCKLSRLNEGNFVIELPADVPPPDLLTISPWTGSQGPLSVVWVLDTCGMHLEPIKVSTGGSHYKWALVPCDMNTLVQDLTNIIGKLTNREIVACFRQEGRKTHRMGKSRLLRDCEVGPGMYLEVEVRS